MAVKRYELVQDRKGVWWDLLLYIPTVTALLSMAAKFWFGNDANLAYLLLFLGSFFLIAGANRVLKTRLMLLPTAPVAIELDGKHLVALSLRSGERLELVSDIRFYPDYAGKSFGLVGLDRAGKRSQFVFHKGQFGADKEFQAVRDTFRG